MCNFYKPEGKNLFSWVFRNPFAYAFRSRKNYYKTHFTINTKCLDPGPQAKHYNFLGSTWAANVYSYWWVVFIIHNFQNCLYFCQLLNFLYILWRSSLVGNFVSRLRYCHLVTCETVQPLNYNVNVYIVWKTYTRTARKVP